MCEDDGEVFHEFSLFKFNFNLNELQQFQSISDKEVEQLKQNIINMLNTIKTNPDPMFEECYNYVTSGNVIFCPETSRMTVDSLNSIVYIRSVDSKEFEYKIYYNKIDGSVIKVEEIVKLHQKIRLQH